MISGGVIGLLVALVLLLAHRLGQLKNQSYDTDTAMARYRETVEAELKRLRISVKAAQEETRAVRRDAAKKYAALEGNIDKYKTILKMLRNYLTVRGVKTPEDYDPKRMGKIDPASQVLSYLQHYEALDATHSIMARNRLPPKEKLAKAPSH